MAFRRFCVKSICLDAVTGRLNGAGWVMNKVGVSPRPESVSAADHFIKLTAITPASKTYKIILVQNSLSDSNECLK